MGDERERRDATITEMVEALLLFDEPLLNHRFHAMLARAVGDDAKAALGAIPPRVTQAEARARRAAQRWTQMGPRVLPHDLLVSCERLLLESFLNLVENQNRLIVFLSRSAPTGEVRAEFDRTSDDLRAVAEVLRKTLRSAPPLRMPGAPLGEATHPGTREDGTGDLRGQVEAAIRAARAKGVEPRRLLLSHTAVRHLRDQGCFRADDLTVAGVPVAVDFGWDAPAFALETFDVVPLEEAVGRV